MSRDPQGEIAWISNGGYQTLAKPELRAGSLDQPATWDAQVSRWLPVAQALVSPDRTSYVWTDASGQQPGGTHLHRVDLATDSDTVLLNAGDLVAIAYQADAVYLVHGRSSEAGFHESTGLWRFDLTSHTLTSLDDSTTYWYPPTLGTYIGQSAAWRVDLDPSDPAPDLRASGGKSLDRLLRLDFATGRTTYWLTRHGAEVAIIGLDSFGNPLVSVRSGASTEILSMSAPEVGAVVYRGAFSPDDGLAPFDNGTSGGYRPHAVMLDSHGLWISLSTQNIPKLVLFVNGHLESVPALGLDDSVHPWYPAGACLDR